MVLLTASVLQCMEDPMQPGAGGTGSSGPPQGGQQMNKVREEGREGELLGSVQPKCCVSVNR